MPEDPLFRWEALAKLDRDHQKWNVKRSLTNKSVTQNGPNSKHNTTTTTNNNSSHKTAIHTGYVVYIPGRKAFCYIISANCNFIPIQLLKAKANLWANWKSLNQLLVDKMTESNSVRFSHQLLSSFSFLFHTFFCRQGYLCWHVTQWQSLWTCAVKLI